MHSGRVARLVTIAALILGVGAPADMLAAGQRRPGGAAPAPPPTRGTPASGPMRGHRPAAPQPGVDPNAPPFPNVATLSGPLPFGVNPPPTVGVKPSRDVFRAGPRTFRPRPGFFPYAYGGYFYGDGTAVPDYAQAAPQALPADGLLRLDVTPTSAQVFVDGFYVGTVEDVDNRRGLMLSEGPHRLEFRARGYNGDAVSVQITPNDAVTYRGSLEPQVSPAPPRPPRANASTMYVVPGCYLGNVPPRPDRVASGCDVSKVRVVRPPAS